MTLEWYLRGSFHTGEALPCDTGIVITFFSLGSTSSIPSVFCSFVPYYICCRLPDNLKLFLRQRYFVGPNTSCTMYVLDSIS